MTNYYKVFENLVKNNKFHNTTMNIDDFEKLIKVFFGFGNNHSIKRWIKNFEEVDFISINRVDDKWIVKINIGGISDEVE